MAATHRESNGGFSISQSRPSPRANWGSALYSNQLLNLVKSDTEFYDFFHSHEEHFLVTVYHINWQKGGNLKRNQILCPLVYRRLLTP